MVLVIDRVTWMMFLWEWDTLVLRLVFSGYPYGLNRRGNDGLYGPKNPPQNSSLSKPWMWQFVSWISNVDVEQVAFVVAVVVVARFQSPRSLSSSSPPHSPTIGTVVTNVGPTSILISGGSVFLLYLICNESSNGRDDFCNLLLVVDFFVLSKLPIGSIFVIEESSKCWGQ